MGFGIIYIILGVLFTGLAAYSGQDSGWSFLTILYATIAVIDLGAGVRHIQRHRLNKQKK